MSITTDIKSLAGIVARARSTRRSRKAWEHYSSTTGKTHAGPTEVVVYFADATVNIYQIQQWYEPLRQLSQRHPVTVIARDINTAVLLAKECPLRIIHLEQIADIEAWVAQQNVAVVIYLNQNSRNFQMLRFREPAHIFASHGESEKDYMVSNQLKAYDYTLVAGDAAVERIRKRLVGYDADTRLIKIGRPQVDVSHAAPHLPQDKRTVVLYAPTWEGDRPSMSYSSLNSHAELLIRALINSKKHRIIYRPHPRTGITDEVYLDAHRRIVGLIGRANRADSTAFHIVDTDTTFGWHLKSADVCIADISAVAFDWLASGKPLVLTEPLLANAEIQNDGIAGQLPSVSASEAGHIIGILAEINTVSRRDTRQEIVKHYFGDTSPGVATELFKTAIDKVISTRAK